MRLVTVLQNTDWEYLGYLEDHLEGRNIRFRYIRPAHDLSWQKGIRAPSDGLIVLGAAPYGTVSEPLLPGLKARVSEIRRYLDADLPVVGFGAGAQMLLMAAGHPPRPAEGILSIETARQVETEALSGYLPDCFPVVTFMRDDFTLPNSARALARTQSDRVALFQLKQNCFGFLGHPGMKSAMIEDSLVQFPEHALGDAAALQGIKNIQNQVADSLIPMMTGLIQMTGWMQPE